MHLPVTVPPLLRQLVPRLRLRQQLGDGALRQAQYVLGEQPLPNVVDREQLADASRDVQRVQILRGVLVHVVAQHLLQFRLHWIALRYETLAQSAHHRAGCHAEILGEPERRAVLFEPVRTLQVVASQEIADRTNTRAHGNVVVADMVVVVVLRTLGVAVHQEGGLGGRVLAGGVDRLRRGRGALLRRVGRHHRGGRLHWSIC